MNARITLHDNPQSAIIKMADGNPGALTAMMEIYQNSPRIDPENAFGGLAPILHLDTLRLYGSEIYIIFNDKCNCDCRKMLILLRAAQLGFLPAEQVQEMAVDQMRSIDLTPEEWEQIDKQVCKRLPQFQKA